jgi:hypothetical protein
VAIGFVWISLDSLVRIETFQWVAPTKASRIFPTAFAVAKGPFEGQTTILQAEGTDRSWEKLTSISDFLQGISHGDASLAASSGWRSALGGRVCDGPDKPGPDEQLLEPSSPSEESALRAASRRFDIVAVGIEDEGRVIIRGEVARARGAVVFTSGCKRRIVKRPDGGLVRTRQR